MTKPVDWLNRALVDAPAPVREAMAKRAADYADLPAAEAFARAALAEYASVLRGRGGREDAFPLLVADALLTHAFEAEVALAPPVDDSDVERIWNEGLGELIKNIDREPDV